MEGTKVVISFLEGEAIPTITNVIEHIHKVIGKAKSNRTNCLIVKSTGVGVSGVGSIFTIAGVALAPFTMGISVVPCAGICIAMTAGGVVTSVGTTIADRRLQKRDIKKCELFVRTLQNLQNTWKSRLDSSPGLEEQLLFLMGDSSDNILRINPTEGTQSQNNYLYLLQWLEMGNMYSDEDIDISQIMEGDHIYRPSKKYFGVRVKHHGVYLGNDQVVDFGDKKKSNPPIIRSLADYLSGSEIVRRRNYGEYQIPIEDSIKLARKIVNDKNWEKYHLLQNNCEHFATFLKLNYKWSEQVQSASKIGKGVLTGVKIANKPVQLALDSVGVAVKSLSQSSGFWTKIFKGAVPGTMTGLSKTVVVLGPVMTAVDIGLLLSEWLTKQPNIENFEKALTVLEKELQNYKLYLAHSMEILQMEKQRTEQNEIGR